MTQFVANSAVHTAHIWDISVFWLLQKSGNAEGNTFGSHFFSIFPTVHCNLAVTLPRVSPSRHSPAYQIVPLPGLGEFVFVSSPKLVLQHFSIRAGKPVAVFV